MEKRNVVRVVVLFVLLCLVGCATKSIMLKPTFWEQQDIKIGIALASYPIVGFHKVGSQGLLDMAITDATTGAFQAYLETIDLSDFTAIIDKSVESCEGRGLTTINIEEFVDLEQFPKFKAPSSSGNYTKLDFRSLGEENNINMLLLFSIEAVGSIRPYYGFVATGRPKAYCAAKGQLIDLATNEILWLYTMSEKEASIPVEGEWKQPPDYPNLTKAIEQAIESAKTTLETAFFGSSGSSGFSILDGIRSAK